MVLVQLVCCLSSCPPWKNFYPLEGDAQKGLTGGIDTVQPAEISKEKQKEVYEEPAFSALESDSFSYTCLPKLQIFRQATSSTV